MTLIILSSSAALVARRSYLAFDYPSERNIFSLVLSLILLAVITVGSLEVPAHV